MGQDTQALVYNVIFKEVLDIKPDMTYEDYTQILEVLKDA